MKRWIFILLFPAISHLAYTQNYIPKVKTYTTEDGLSSNDVYAIHKDSKGFMWIGTQYGLNRFDGREFKVYTKDNLPGLQFNIIQGIMEDGAGKLWLLKTNGKYEHPFSKVEINLFHPQSGKVHSLFEFFGDQLPFQVEEISYVKQLTDQSIFIYCQSIKAAFIYRSEVGFQTFNIPSEIQKINNIRLQRDGHFLFINHLSSEELFIYKINKKGKIIAQLNIEQNWKLKNGTDKIVRSPILGMTYNLTLCNYFNPNLDKSHDFNAEPIKERIEQAAYNPYQQLFWLRTGGRVSVFSPDGKQVYEYDENLSNIGDNPFLFDQETTWTSSRKNGLVAITLEPVNFETQQFFNGSIKNSMRGIIKDKTDVLWFSTVYGMGRMKADRAISIIHTDQRFTSFLEDQKGNIWYNENTDLIKYEFGEKKRTIFPIEMTPLIWSLFEADNGEIWLGTTKGLVHALDPATSQISIKASLPFDPDIQFNIYAFQKRDKHSVWLCTNQGLFLVDQSGNLLATYNEKQKGEFYLPANEFHHLHQDQNDMLWLATGDAGLIRLDLKSRPIYDEDKLLKSKFPSSTVYKQFTTSDGLSSNSLHAIYEDDFDYLWISSDDGLMQLDKKNYQIKKYFKPNGIAHNEFNRIAHFKGKDGRLYFGGLDGLTAFDPKDFANTREKMRPPVLAIAELQQFSGEKGVFENQTNALLKNNKITLNPGDRIFNLNLALLDYKHNKNSVYHYRIKEIYDWQSTATNQINISNLPYGKHVLEVKAQNGNRQHAANTLEIDIQVLRPFYLQWWFVSLSIIVLSLGIWFFFRRRTQQLLVRQEANQLRDLDKMKSRFFTNISHELRTPLTLIGLPLEHLLKNLDKFNQAEIRQYIEAAQSNKKDMNRLINEILDLSKLEVGKLELEEKAIDLQYFLNRTVNLFQSSAATKGINFQFLSDIPEQITVQLDETKLEMVINNLLSNALKFTPENGMIVVKSAWTTTHELQFKVEDNGRGIYRDDLAQVFERYFQSNKEEKLEGGSGIGLAICKELMELMGGKIQVESELGKGSTFSFYLPLKTVNATNTSPKEEWKENNTGSFLSEAVTVPFSKEKKTILLVEDHPELLQHLQNILSPLYNILTTTNGEEALKLLRESLPPDLILSDVMMPKMDGFTLLKKVRTEDKFCGIPFILLTARADIKDKLKGLRIGVDDYMIKPFNIEELLLRINNLLTNAQNRKFTAPELVSENKDEKIKVSAPTTSIYQPTPADLDWLQEVETIALREIKNKDYTLEDLAKELLISYSSFRQKIKLISGLPPNRYIRSIRLHHAKYIMETREINTLKEIAFEIGFEGLTHFSKLFEAEFGKHPQEFLNKHSSIS